MRFRHCSVHPHRALPTPSARLKLRARVTYNPMLTLTTWNAVINILSVPSDQRGSVISAARDDAGITALLAAENRDRGALLERLNKLDVLPNARAPLGYEVTSCVPMAPTIAHSAFHDLVPLLLADAPAAAPFLRKCASC